MEKRAAERQESPAGRYPRAWLLAAAALATGPLLPERAAAQSVEDGAIAITDGTVVLAPISVTARRDTERLSNVPVSVGIAGPRAIESENPSNAAIDISRQIPNYSVTDVGNPLYAFGAIRGVGTLSFPMNPFDSTIGHSMNGMPISMYGGTQQLLDVERVEVMRGPQNVLFGRSSQGGTVNIVTAEPDGERDLRVRGEVGTNGEYLADVIAGGSIVEGRLDGRGAVRLTGGDGEVNNLIDGEDLPERTIGAARGAVRFYLGDDTTVTARGYFEHDERETFNYILRGGAGYPAVMLDDPLRFDRDLAIGSLAIKHAFETFDLTGTFGAQDIVSHLSSDNTDGLVYAALTGIPASSFSSATCSDCTKYYRFTERAFSGELRASSKEGAKYRWTAGISGYRSDFEHYGINTSSSVRPRTVPTTPSSTYQTIPPSRKSTFPSPKDFS